MTKSRDRVTKSKDRVTKSKDRVTKPKDRWASGSTWGGPGGFWASPAWSGECPRQISGPIFFSSLPMGKIYETPSDFFFGSSSDETGVK